MLFDLPCLTRGTERVGGSTVIDVTDKHQYLLYSSSHPFHTKKSVPYSLALRLRRICSKEDSFNIRATELELYLTKRGYKNRIVKSQIARAKLILRNDALNEHNHDTPKPTRVPFIVTYNPALPNIREILHKKQPILDSTERSHNIFSETPVVAFRSPNLRVYWFAPSLKLPKVYTLRQFVRRHKFLCFFGISLIIALSL